jgi:hypothetical protein
MANKERAPRPLPDEMEFTPQSVHRLLVEVSTGDPSLKIPPVDHPVISALVTQLKAYRRQVDIERGSQWIEGVQARQKYAEISPVLAEIISVLRKETEEAFARCDAGIDPNTATGVSNLVAREEHRVGIEKLDEFEANRHWLDDNAFYQHPVLLGTVDFWEAYAEPLAAAFTSTVTRPGANPAPLGNPLYRFVEKLVPFLTGERPTFNAVETRLSRGRPVNWAKGGFPP